MILAAKVPFQIIRQQMSDHIMPGDDAEEQPWFVSGKTSDVTHYWNENKMEKSESRVWTIFRPNTGKRLIELSSEEH